MDSKGDKFYHLGAIKKSLSVVAMNGAPNKTGQSAPKDRETSDTDWDTISESEESDWINESTKGDTESDSDEAVSPQKSGAMLNEDWADELRSTMICAFKLQPGLKFRKGKTPVYFFKKLFTPELFEFLVDNINNNIRKARSWCQGQATHLREVTENEFRVFFGLYLNIATLYSTVVEDFGRTDHIIENSEEYRSMTENRFQVILKSLNFKHHLPDNNGRSSKIAHMINYFNIIMKTLIIPERILCVAESLQVPCREHIHLLTDEFGLAHKLLVCDSDDKPGPHIAKRLLDDKLDFGHSVYMNDGFTSIGLAKFLLEHKTYVTGPLERKSKGIPSEVIEKQLRVGEKITKYNSDGISLTKFRETKRYEKITMSTRHSGEWRETIDIHKVTSKKPASVLAYRKYKRGIDKHEDMMASYYYLIESKYNKYTRIGLHILQMLVLNAYIMYNKYGEKPLLMVDFRTVVTKYLRKRGHVRGST